MKTLADRIPVPLKWPYPHGWNFDHLSGQDTDAVDGYVKDLEEGGCPHSLVGPV